MSVKSAKHAAPRQAAEQPVPASTGETLIILALLWTMTATIVCFLPNAVLMVPAALLASVALVVASRAPHLARKIIDCSFAYRWLLALVVFALCVALQLHGSSIGIYDEVLPTMLFEGDATLFGEPRWIRSDEFGVATPTFFSQAYHGHALYGTQMGLSPTNMMLDYYGPVWDVAALGKPLLWGYLLLGNAYGLSWYWCGQAILLFMTALEMCLILTQGRRLESLLGALMVALSPAIQWWFLPHMPIVILYAMALFCLGYAFFTTDSRVWRLACAVVASLTVVGFVLSIFPSFQVPCSYVVVALLVACLVRDRERVHLAREVWMTFALALVVAAVLVGWALWTARADLALVAGTVYPGTRFETGGTRSVSDLFCDLSSIFLPYKDNTVSGLNSCESATALHVAPFVAVLMPRLLWGLRRREDANALVGIVLWVLVVLQGLFMVVGIPPVVAQVTLLRYCNRMHEVYAWAAVLFTVWGLSAVFSHPDLLTKGERIAYPLGYGVLSWYLVSDSTREYFAQTVIHGIPLGKMAGVCALLGIVAVLTLALFRQERLTAACIALAMVFAGATVNPVERGIGALTNHPLSAHIQELAAAEPESRWLCTDTAFFFFSNYVMANGAQVVNATNFYPDVQKWAVLDPEGTYEEITNRYANESAVLTDEPTSVELASPDHLVMHLNPQDLKALSVRYVLSTKDYTELLGHFGITCALVDGQDGYAIYRLTYDELAGSEAK